MYRALIVFFVFQPFQLTVDVKIIGFRSAASSGAVTTAYDAESNKVSIFIPGAKLER